MLELAWFGRVVEAHLARVKCDCAVYANDRLWLNAVLQGATEDSMTSDEDLAFLTQ